MPILSTQGSGNIGGGVNYRTLEPFDIVRNGRKFGATYIVGWLCDLVIMNGLSTLGVAYAGEKAEAIIALFSTAHGHEMKSRWWW